MLKCHGVVVRTGLSTRVAHLIRKDARRRTTDLISLETVVPGRKDQRAVELRAQLRQLLSRWETESGLVVERRDFEPGRRFPQLSDAFSDPMISCARLLCHSRQRHWLRWRQSTRADSEIHAKVK
jgi:hypothetical protein